MNECGYPIYPFQPNGVQFFIHSPAPCSLDVEFAVTWDYGSIYWGYPFPYYQTPDWSSGPVTVYLPEAGSYYVTGLIPELDRPCYHVPFFAKFSLFNSDDFTEGQIQERCHPDTSCNDRSPDQHYLQSCCPQSQEKIHNQKRKHKYKSHLHHCLKSRSP